MKTLCGKKEISALAGRIASRLKGGEVFLLEGELGSGKTFFVQQIGKFLGAKAVKSPSFVVLEVHSTQKNFQIAHFDFYRFSVEEVSCFEWPDYLFRPEYVSFIEWGEKIEPFLKGKKYFKIKFETTTKNKRLLSLFSNLRKWLKNT